MSKPRAPLSLLAANVTLKVGARVKDPERPYVGLEHLSTDVPEIVSSSASSASIGINTVFEAGDTLFGKLRPNLRKVALAQFGGYCSTDVLVLRARSGVDPAYLSHALRSNDVVGFAVATAYGTKMPRTSWSLLSPRNVLSPTLPEQRRIAKILDSLDARMSTSAQIIDKMTAIRAGLLHDLMTRGIDESGGLRPHVDNAPSQYREGACGVRPRVWKIGRLDDFARRGSGHTPNKNDASYWNGGIKWVSLADSSKLDRFLISETDKQISAEGVANSSAVLHPAGTVILSRDAGVGKSAILAENMAVSQHFMAWQAGPEIDGVFLYYWLQFMKRSFEGIAMGSTIQTIGLSYFRKLQAVVPPLAEQECIAVRMRQVDLAIDRARDELSALQQLKIGLSADLFACRTELQRQVKS